ncbi:NAD(P)H-dependent oxidoreductase [Helicobacter sp. 11S03491-1]|uniref:NAD(P)H-dependent oxidoreductase n=1 Tax=Helicobacter sp. 11S03491-1 TaxID=1476196 RepID=UPI000BA606F7|nr:NAD(P)H-dependent oxidoreductase [Helicobacter sp. 11S03491-1]PAF42674.1 hypothetical protein BKH45_03960 [Helicobacter sp. 11S03491-1]
MKTLIILAHPNLEESVVNKALTQSIIDADITVRDIYKIYPQGKIDRDKEVALLGSHDKVIFQFPLYWFSCPSLLKEWEDCALSGVSFGPNPKMLANKIFQVITSTGSPIEKYQSDGRNQKTLEEILLPFSLCAKYLGMKVAPIHCTYNTMGMTDELLTQAIESYKKALLEK